MRKIKKHIVKWSFILALLPLSVSAGEQAQTTKQIRSILAKAPKGKAYETEFKEILELGQKSVPSLIEVFHDGRVDWNERWIVAMALGRYKTRESRKALEKGLKDSFPTIRMASAKALGYMNDLAAAPALRKALPDEAMVVRSAVATSLGQMKDPDSIDTLLSELMSKRNFNQGKSFWVREDILDALGNIGDNKAVPVLKEVLREKEKNILQKTCSALEKIDPQAAKSLKHPTGNKCHEEWLKWYSNH